MKKLFGKAFGGLQKKSIALVLAILLLAAMIFAAILLYQNTVLSRVLRETRGEQQEAISQRSKEAMYSLLESSMADITELEAEIADNDFAEVINSVYMIQSMAHGLFASSEPVTPKKIFPPDPSYEGVSSAYVLCEENVDYTQSEYLGILAHLSTPMIAMNRNSEKMDGCFIGLNDGTFICVDDKPKNKYDRNGELIPFPVRERPWYKGALEADGTYFTGITPDAFSGKLLITCSAPLYDKGEAIGVIGVDIVLSSMMEFVRNADSGMAYVVNDRGQVILGPEDGESIFAIDDSEYAADLRESDNAALADFIKHALDDPTGITLLTVDDKEYYFVGSPMLTVGWTLISAVEKSIPEQPEKQLLSEYAAINDKAVKEFGESMSYLRLLIAALLTFALVFGFFAARFAAKRMVKPIEEMTRNVRKDSQTGETFRMLDCYRTGDEIEVLAEAFAEMSKTTKAYYDENLRITKEKERVSTELHMASQIQEGMLPSSFPAFPNRKDFDIFASMDPAREVGGDFYDFFLVDDDHLCLIMADVSGKGVPAALFMMASKIILASNAMIGKSPAQILTDTNTAICSNNPREMFVTVWLGILELSSGRLVCANAGHEYPAFKKPSGEFELFKDKHGFVVGGMQGIVYKEYELMLEPGSKLFVYTDGVPEASDSKNELFGTERMIAALNCCADNTPQQLLESVREAVDAFAGEAEQFDDLTMLCLEYFGSEAGLK